MAPGTLSAAPDKFTPNPDLVNRRVSLRYAAGPATATSMARPGKLFRRVRVQDISQGGIALLLREPFRPGEQIYIQIRNRILDFSYDLPAQVRHVTKKGRGTWLIGFEFARELSLAELASLL